MDSKEKKALSETDICDLFITPALKKAGWDQMKQIRREFITPGPIIVRGNMSSRNKKKSKRADYVLQWQSGIPIAVVEAKENNHTVSHGMQQALGYADLLQVPSAFSSNGDAFASHNKEPEDGEDIECEFPLDEFPSPDVLWKRYKKHRNIKADEEELILQPYHKDSYGKEPRYYQSEAINRCLEAVAKGQNRLLLVMATGTGKTYTTFQIIWRLWKAKRAKRTLFLVDRNFLADQTLVNDFNTQSGIRVIKITNAGVGEVIETEDFLPTHFQTEYENFQVFKGDMILALTRPYISTGLKISICPELYNHALLNQRVAAIRCFVDTNFTYQYMQSKYVLGLYQKRFSGSGLQPNLKTADVTELVIPISPLAEQERIVAKVEELMALCDQLKMNFNTAQSTQLKLSDSLVKEAIG